MTTMSVHDGALYVVDTDRHEGHVIPLEAIASWRALLKYDTDAETVQAILTAQDTTTVGDDGTNPWSSAYQQLADDANGTTTDRAIDGATEARMRLGLVQPNLRLMHANFIQLASTASTDVADGADAVPMPAAEGMDIPSLDDITNVLDGVQKQLDTDRQRFLDRFKTDPSPNTLKE